MAKRAKYDKNEKVCLSVETRNRILARFRELGSILIEPKVRDRSVKNTLCLRRKGIKVVFSFLRDKVKLDVVNNGEKREHAIEISVDKNVSEEFVSNLHEEYEKMIKSLRDEQWYAERIDPSRAQVSVPEIYYEAVEKLKPSLVFAMSKGSHELFHSNIWAWLIEKDSRFARAFIPDIKGEIEAVKREEGIGGGDKTLRGGLPPPIWRLSQSVAWPEPAVSGSPLNSLLPPSRGCGKLCGEPVKSGNAAPLLAGPSF